MDCMRRITADRCLGTVISGASEIDESMVAGESRPVEKATGSSVIAGSINGQGALTIRLTRLSEDNTVNLICGMVDEAKLSKPKVQDVQIVLPAISSLLWLV